MQTEAVENDRIIDYIKAGDLPALQSVPLALLGTQPNCVRDKFGCACVHWAAGCGHLKCLIFLIETARADPNDKARDSLRIPGHYAARNGHIDCVKYLAEVCNCDLNATGALIQHTLPKHGVSPYQLAVWQNHLQMVQYLTSSPFVKADPHQVNEFACSAVHWLGTATRARAGEDGCDLIPMAEWLLEAGCDFNLIQRSGHTALHKAAWGNHKALCEWLKNRVNLWDNIRDVAGNYAADIATMGQHYELADWLRKHCSVDRTESYMILGLDENAMSTLLSQPIPKSTPHTNNDHAEKLDLTEYHNRVREAYLEKARHHHPDRNSSPEASEMFVKVKRAYDHLINEGGIGRQSNSRHNIHFMITSMTNETADCEMNQGDIPDAQQNPLLYFKARLVATLLDYKSIGLPISNLKRKWSEIWPERPFPDQDEMEFILREYHNHSLVTNHQTKINPNQSVLKYSSEPIHCDDNSNHVKIYPKAKPNKNKKIKVIEFLREVAHDCCVIEQGTGTELILFPVSNISTSIDSS